MTNLPVSGRLASVLLVRSCVHMVNSKYCAAIFVCSGRTCNPGGFFPPTSGSDDRECATTCASTTTCGGITIPDDHLKVGAH